jgi:hypothetical protein
VTTLQHGRVSASREDLYEKVWNVSVTKLAKSYGISDVGLAKACKRHQIPRPPMGYWAQKAAGRAPKRPPLPAVVDPKLQTVEFAPGPSRPKEPDESTLLQERVPTFDDPKLKATYERFLQAVPSIQVSDRLRGRHQLIVSTRHALERSTKGDRYVSRGEQQFLFSPRHDDSQNAIDISVGKESFGRALRWLETSQRIRRYLRSIRRLMTQRQQMIERGAGCVSGLGGASCVSI